MIVVAAHITLKPGKKEEFWKLAQECIATTRTENGCISYTLFASMESEDKLVFLEEWETRAALDAHLQAPHLKAFSAATTPLRACDTDLWLYEAEKLN